MPGLRASRLCLDCRQAALNPLATGLRHSPQCPCGATAFVFCKNKTREFRFSRYHHGRALGQAFAAAPTQRGDDEQQHPRLVIAARHCARRGRAMYSARPESESDARRGSSPSAEKASFSRRSPRRGPSAQILSLSVQNDHKPALTSSKSSPKEPNFVHHRRCKSLKSGDSVPKAIQSSTPVARIAVRLTRRRRPKPSTPLRCAAHRGERFEIAS